jgi:DNA-binding NtrC family response regulator
MESVLLSSGYPEAVLAAVRKKWKVIDIPNQQEALAYFQLHPKSLVAACIGNVVYNPQLNNHGDANNLDAWTLMKEIHKIEPELPVIISTSLSTPRTIVDLVKCGAFDYVVEPFDKNDPQLLAGYIHDLVFALTRATQWREMFFENRRLKEDLIRKTLPDFIQGNSPGLMRVMELIRKVAPTPATVLITGESGTGKEIVARAIHSMSANKAGPFVAVNCGSLSETLLASELFGYVKGAFTGADTNHSGLIQEADGGTLFLDEIATVSQNFQVMLLRVLEQRKARPVGGRNDYPVNCRFVAAANRNLEEMVSKGEFREDLFYRLNVFHIHIPPLRERKEDISVLADFFMRQTAGQYGKNISRISPAALDLLEKYRWPGNVRQLRNAIERAIISCDGESLNVDDFDSHIRNGPATTESISELLCYDEAMKQYESRLIRSAIMKANDNISEAARILGMKRTTLAYRIHQLGLKNEDKNDKFTISDQ